MALTTTLLHPSRTAAFLASFLSLVPGAWAVGFNYTTLIYPGAASPTGTVASGINDNGQIVGYYDAGGGHIQGFEATGGVISPLPSYTPSSNGYSTYALGIDDSGDIVGQIYAGSFGFEGFYDTGIIGYPGGRYSGFSGINNAGAAVGNYTDGNFQAHGLELSADGTETSFSVPGAVSTEASGINGEGEIAGTYTTADGVDHGFLLGADGTTFTSLNFGLGNTWLNGINDAGQIVGTYIDSAGNDSGFLLSADLTTLTAIGPMGSSQALGINNLGQIVGSYTYDGYTAGFEATPTPEPGTLALLGIGLIAFDLLRRRRR